MKKVFLFFGLLAAVCSQALAQDTLTMDAPPSNYLYMVWSDQDSLRHSALGFTTIVPEHAVAFDTKDTLQVYGLAMMPKLGEEHYSHAIDSTLDSVYFYARLYAKEPDSLRVIEQRIVHLRDTPISYYLAFNKFDITHSVPGEALELLPPFAVYETYFDAPVTVIDTFFVGVRDGGTHYQVNDSTYNTLYYFAIRYVAPNHPLLNERQTDAIYSEIRHGWRFYTSWPDRLFMMFPILTPDTTGGGTGTGEGDDSLAVQQVQLVDRLVAVQPNPATERVKVVSSCGMERLTAYDAAGKQVHRQDASGLSTTLDVSCWPAGTYILHVQTPMGTSAKRLVVTR